MSDKEKYDEIYPDLVTKLPMKDVTFLAKLTKERLFTGDLKDEVNAKATAAQAAAHFLDSAISPYIEEDGDVDLEPLYKLLKAMEKHGGILKKLVAKIKKALPYSGSGEAGSGASAAGIAKDLCSHTYFCKVSMISMIKQVDIF